MAIPFHTVPWQEADQWKGVSYFFENIFKRFSYDQIHGLKALTHEIDRAYGELDIAMDGLCHGVCPACPDNCCARAQVYYDFKDLAFYYARFSTLPGKQLVRPRKEACPMLGPSGCRLSRNRRPFLCTWYLCPDLKRVGGRTLSIIEGLIIEIKNYRSRLEDYFI